MFSTIRGSPDINSSPNFHPPIFFISHICCWWFCCFHGWRQLQTFCWFHFPLQTCLGGRNKWCLLSSCAQGIVVLPVSLNRHYHSLSTEEHSSLNLLLLTCRLHFQHKWLLLLCIPLSEGEGTFKYWKVQLAEQCLAQLFWVQASVFYILIKLMVEFRVYFCKSKNAPFLYLF